MAIKVKLVDKLAAENKTLKAENEQLRNAARQLLTGLTEYAKADNWKYDEGFPKAVWQGDGDGPKTAKYYLGLLEEAEQN